MSKCTVSVKSRGSGGHTDAEYFALIADKQNRFDLISIRLIAFAGAPLNFLLWLLPILVVASSTLTYVGLAILGLSVPMAVLALFSVLIVSDRGIAWAKDCIWTVHPELFEYEDKRTTKP